MLDLKKISGFDWDAGNISKNWISHQVQYFEAEQIFFNQPLLVENDEKHSQKETRYYALGVTEDSRCLFVVFTVRKNLIRVISARDMNRKERKIIMKKRKKTLKFSSEDQERKFWASHDSTEYIDWSKAKKAVFPNLKPSTRSISIRLPESLLNDLKMMANKKDVPYQTLMKVLLSERIQEEKRHLAA